MYVSERDLMKIEKNIAKMKNNNNKKNERKEMNK